jgi:hypothetical protein
MSIVFMLLGAIFCLAGFVCFVIILIEAFKDAIWKGLVGLLCGLYMLYYALAEFEHENKWLIVAGWIFGGAIGGALLGAAGAFAAPATSG